MKKLLLVLGLFLGVAVAQGQTNTPTPSNTPTPTPTATATFTPSQTFTPSSTPTPVAGLPRPSVTLLIASGGTLSSMARLNEGQVQSITIHPPAAIDGTVTVLVADDATTPVWRTLQYPNTNTDVTLVALKTVTITDVTAALLQIKESSSAAAARSFVVTSVRKFQ